MGLRFSSSCVKTEALYDISGSHSCECEVLVFWDVASCSLGVDQHFRGAYCPHHQGGEWQNKSVLWPMRHPILHLLTSTSKTIQKAQVEFITKACDNKNSWHTKKFQTSIIFLLQPFHLNTKLVPCVDSFRVKYALQMASEVEVGSVRSGDHGGHKTHNPVVWINSSVKDVSRMYQRWSSSLEDPMRQPTNVTKSLTVN
jgi:hypothetical protein